MKKGGVILIKQPKLVCKLCHEAGGYTCEPHECYDRQQEVPKTLTGTYSAADMALQHQSMGDLVERTL